MRRKIAPNAVYDFLCAGALGGSVAGLGHHLGADARFMRSTTPSIFSIPGSAAEFNERPTEYLLDWQLCMRFPSGPTFLDFGRQVLAIKWNLMARLKCECLPTFQNQGRRHSIWEKRSSWQLAMHPGASPLRRAGLSRCASSHRPAASVSPLRASILRATRSGRRCRRTCCWRPFP